MRIPLPTCPTVPYIFFLLSIIGFLGLIQLFTSVNGRHNQARFLIGIK